MTRKQCNKLAISASTLDIGSLQKQLARIARKKSAPSSWGRESWKLLQWLKDMSTNPPYRIFVKGNVKLPFYSFSVLPVYTCPGAGDCAVYCYSLKAWRYPSAFMRQLQNTILIMTQSAHIVDAWYALRQDSIVRLYVDGDFDSVDSVQFWFDLCKQRNDLKVYGYSKSWHELLAYKGTLPTNYKLNLSTGHNHNKRTETRIRKLSIVRGSFITVPVDKSVVGKYKTAPYLASLKQSATAAGIDKYFACPGKCGVCTKKAHACGSDTFNNVPILIGIH